MDRSDIVDHGLPGSSGQPGGPRPIGAYQYTVDHGLPGSSGRQGGPMPIGAWQHGDMET
jgi:hypothetical protein